MEIPLLLFVFAGLLFFGLLVLILMYNGFVGRRQAVRNSFATIDVQLKRRWDLIPQLVAIAKEFARHERAVLEDVVQARRTAQSAPSLSGKRFQAEGKMSRGVGNLLALAENYPDLKSSAQFMNLQRNLTEVESQISAARRAYNAAVTDWNNGVETIPSCFMARSLGHERMDLFEILREERRVPGVRV